MLFIYEQARVRTVLKDGIPWFIAKDVCEVLRISKYRDAVARLDEEDSCPVMVDTRAGKRAATAINESGLYQLIFTSRKEEAKQFKRWVTSEVLPSIRKYGQYAVEEMERQEGAQELIERWNHELETKWIPRLLSLPEGE